MAKQKTKENKEELKSFVIRGTAQEGMVADTMAFLKTCSADTGKHILTTFARINTRLIEWLFGVDNQSYLDIRNVKALELCDYDPKTRLLSINVVFNNKRHHTPNRQVVPHRSAEQLKDCTFITNTNDCGFYELFRAVQPINELISEEVLTALKTLNDQLKKNHRDFSDEHSNITRLIGALSKCIKHKDTHKIANFWVLRKRFGTDRFEGNYEIHAVPNELYDDIMKEKEPNLFESGESIF